MPSGGARAGAGRKPRSEKFQRPIAAAEKRIADRLPQIIDNLFLLADGGYLQVTETWEAAGLLTSGQGEATVPAFPDKRPDELVLTRSTRSIAAPDRGANQDLLNRIAGKPTAALEISGAGGEPIVFSLHLGDAEPTG
jgi:hypothetical protein